jgi:flagellar protein FliS
MTASGTNAYLRTKVMTANPAELRLMLFDGAIRFAEQTSAALERKDYEACYTNATRCQAILMELINGLKPEHDPQLCNRLSGLYTFLYTRLMQASNQREPALIDEVLKLLNYERDTWNMLLDQLAAENRAAAAATDVPRDVAPTVPPNAAGLGSIIGGTVSVRG